MTEGTDRGHCHSQRKKTPNKQVSAGWNSEDKPNPRYRARQPIVGAKRSTFLPASLLSAVCPGKSRSHLDDPIAQERPKSGKVLSGE